MFNRGEIYAYPIVSIHKIMLNSFYTLEVRKLVTDHQKNFFKNLKHMQVGCMYSQSLKNVTTKKVNQTRVTQTFGTIDLFKTDKNYKLLPHINICIQKFI